MKTKKILSTSLLCIAVLILISCGKNKIIQSSENKAGGEILFKKNPETFVTSDGLNIKGYYYYKSSGKTEPLIILIHQFNSNQKQWSNDFIDTLMENGYKVLTYDIRSHGESDKAEVEFQKLLTDREQTPKDLKAIIEWTKKQKGIDSNRIGIVGTSIGASLALYGKFYLGVKSIVGISGGKSTFEGLTGLLEVMMGHPVIRIKNVLFICGNKDGDYAKEEQYIYDNYVDPPEDFKIFDSDKHGKDLISQFPEINNLIVSWFAKTL
jgi:dienelactone hydrolase